MSKALHCSKCCSHLSRSRQRVRSDPRPHRADHSRVISPRVRLGSAVIGSGNPVHFCSPTRSQNCLDPETDATIASLLLRYAAVSAKLFSVIALVTFIGITPRDAPRVDLRRNGRTREASVPPFYSSQQKTGFNSVHIQFKLSQFH